MAMGPYDSNDPRNKKGPLAGLESAMEQGQVGGVVPPGPLERLPGVPQINTPAESANALANMSSVSNVRPNVGSLGGFGSIEEAQRQAMGSKQFGDFGVYRSPLGQQAAQSALAGLEQGLTPETQARQKALNDFAFNKYTEPQQKHAAQFKTGLDLDRYNAMTSAETAQGVARKRDMTELELEPAMTSALEASARRSPAAITGEATLRASEMALERAEMSAAADTAAAKARMRGAIGGPVLRAYMENLGRYQGEKDDVYKARRAAMDAALDAALGGDTDAMRSLGIDEQTIGLLNMQNEAGSYAQPGFTQGAVQAPAKGPGETIDRSVESILQGLRNQNAESQGYMDMLGAAENSDAGYFDEKNRRNDPFQRLR